MDQALSYKDQLSRKDLATLYQKRAYYCSYIQRYSREEKIVFIDQALSYKDQFSEKDLATLYQKKEKVWSKVVSMD